MIAKDHVQQQDIETEDVHILKFLARIKPHLSLEIWFK